MNGKLVSLWLLSLHVGTARFPNVNNITRSRKYILGAQSLCSHTADGISLCGVYELPLQGQVQPRTKLSLDLSKITTWT